MLHNIRLYCSLFYNKSGTNSIDKQNKILIIFTFLTKLLFLTASPAFAVFFPFFPVSEQKAAAEFMENLSISRLGMCQNMEFGVLF